MSQIQLGDRVRDKVTGYEGVAVGRSKWITGCAQIAVQSGTINQNGELSKAEWFDENRLSVTGACAVVIHSADKDGGPVQTK